MTVKKKLLVAFIFLAGFIVTGISIARLIVFTHATETNFTCRGFVCVDISEVHSNIATL